MSAGGKKEDQIPRRGTSSVSAESLWRGGRKGVTPGMSLLIMEGEEEKDTNSLLSMNKGPLHHFCTAASSTDNIKGGL